jgi:hypothetical protein
VIIGSLFSILFVSTLSLPGRNIYGASDLKILTVGNWGCTSNSQATVNNIISKNPDLVLGLGDYSYESTPDCSFNEIKAFDSKMKISIGNHDVENDKLLNSYLQHFGLSKQYYSFNFQNVHVVTMATELELEVGSEQYNFIKNDLQQASLDPNIQWIIVTMHKPIYTSPNGCSASACEGNKNLRDTYHPLFDNYGVDLVLQAHVHSYQRSFPVKYNAQDSSKPIITSPDKKNYNNPDGVIFAIVGTGGINFHGLSGKAPFAASQQDDKFGALELIISNNGNNLVGKFHTNNGKVTDEFNIVKTNKGTPNPTSAQNTDLKAGIEVEEVKEVEDTEVEESKEVEDTEVEDTEVEESKEVEDTPVEESKEVEDTEVEESKDNPDKEVEDTPVEEVEESKEVEDTPVEESEESKENNDTPIEEVEEVDDVEDALVKKVEERKDALVKKVKESLSLSELVQPKDWIEFHISDPDSEESDSEESDSEESDSEEKKVDSEDIINSNSHKKSSKSKHRMLDPFAPLTN